MTRDDQPRGILPSGRAGRWWVLVLAVLIVGGVGAAYFLQWRGGLEGPELVRFFSLYLALPLAAGLLLLFAYLRIPPR